MSHRIVASARAVVRAVRLQSEHGQLAEPDLVQHPAGLLVPEVVRLGALERRERQQRPSREARTEAHRLQGGDERVSPEEREEPRQAGRRQHDVLGLRLHVDPEREQVEGGLGHDLVEQVRIRLQLRDLRQPPADRIRAVRVGRLAIVPVDRLDLPRPELERHVDLATPLAARRQLEVPDEVVAVDTVGRGRHVDPGLGLERLVLVAKHQARPVGCVVALDLGRSVPDEVLHLEEVGEVVADGEAQLDVDRVLGEAAHLDPLMQPAADGPATLDPERVRVQARHPRVGQEERRRIVVDRAGSQGRGAVRRRP